jgi:Tfp pilus assembly protein PilF
MDMALVRRFLAGIAAVATGALALPAVAHAQQSTATTAATTPATDSTSLLERAAAQGRLYAARLDSAAAAQAGRRAPADPSATQYQNGLAQLQNGLCDAAYLFFRGAVASNPNSARNHGDMAFTLACRARLDDAATEYGTAIRMQSTNPWYYVALGVLRASQLHWVEASANFELAYAADSTILDSMLIAAATEAAERSGNENQDFEWAERGTAKVPSDPTPWLHLATLLRARGDTARGLDAIRRFRALDPRNRLGTAVYALYLYDHGQFDSAVVMARQAASDTALHQYASAIFLRAGAHWLNSKQFDSAAAVLAEGRAITPAGLAKMRYTYYLGLADLMRIPTILEAAQHDKDCDKAPVLDSLLTEVQHDITESAQLDSAQTSKILTNYVPALRNRVDSFKSGCHN